MDGIFWASVLLLFGAVIYGFSQPRTPGLQTNDVLWVIFIFICGVVALLSNWLENSRQINKLIAQGKRLERRFKKL